MTLPNFFIVGAPKAGTDALYYDLCQHPEIYMSPLKEPCYFSEEVRLENFEAGLQPQVHAAAVSMRQYLAEGMPNRRFGGIISDFEDYLKLFAKVTGEKAIGEGSVCYLWSRTAAANIASVCPHARIVMVLMDPAERAFHQYLKSVSDGTVGHSFSQHLDHAFGAKSKLGVYNPFLEFGNYAEQVRRFMQAFPADQLRISLYEDLLTDHAEWFSNLLTFLGVDSTFSPGPVKVPSDPRIPRLTKVSYALQLQKAKKLASRLLPGSVRSITRWLVYRKGALPELDLRDRARLVAYYRDDILQLQGLIGRDLSAWLR
jgi:hypothetical protein